MTRWLYASSVPTPEDKEAALFDLLAAWADYVEQKAGGQDGGHGPGSAAAVSARWRSHYTLGYLRRIRALHEMAGVLLWDDDAEEGMRAEEFVRRHLLPFFAADGE